MNKARLTNHHSLVVQHHRNKLNKKIIKGVSGVLKAFLECMVAVNRANIAIRTYIDAVFPPVIKMNRLQILVYQEPKLLEVGKPHLN